MATNTARPVERLLSEARSGRTRLPLATVSRPPSNRDEPVWLWTRDNPEPRSLEQARQRLESCETVIRRIETDLEQPTRVCASGYVLPPADYQRWRHQAMTALNIREMERSALDRWIEAEKERRLHASLRALAREYRRGDGDTIRYLSDLLNVVSAARRRGDLALYANEEITIDVALEHVRRISDEAWERMETDRARLLADA